MSFDILTQYSRLRKGDENLKTLLIDEPDAHIHPDTQANFCKFLALFQKRVGMRIVIATHSLEIVGGLALHCLDRTGCAIVRPMDSEIRAQPLEGMHSEALSALGGGVLMGRLFGSKLMLVEGEDDHDAWSQAARAGRISATIIPCGGGDRMKKKQKLLEDLFSGLRDPAAQPFGIALLDSDKGLPTPTKRNGQKYIRFHRLKCHEIENLVLTDDVLGKVGLDCESALSKLHSWSGAPQKARKLKLISRENRHSVDLKGLMPTIEAVLFPDMGRWTRIVGNVLASSRPSGQLASFLGDELIEALYGPEAGPTVF